jgi:hypothetical protein
VQVGEPRLNRRGVGLAWRLSDRVANVRSEVKCEQRDERQEETGHEKSPDTIPDRDLVPTLRVGTRVSTHCVAVGVMV